MNKRTLHKELRQAGASLQEVTELSQLARQLPELNGLPAKPKRSWWTRFKPVPIAAAIGGLVVGAVLIAVAQGSMPGSALYPVKRLSEQAAVAADPSYRATLMMRRSQEVKQLVNRRAGQGRVLATLANYRRAAAAYKTDNYAAFEYCKTNLAQAAAAAPPAERAAIDSTLHSLQT